MNRGPLITPTDLWKVFNKFHNEKKIHNIPRNMPSINKSATCEEYK